MALRTAEVSGSAGAFVAADFDRAQRRAALRASMRADRFMPVFFGEADGVLDEAARSGRRLVAVEDVGERAPWEVDLRGRVHLVVGGEAEGIPKAALARCETVVRLADGGLPAVLQPPGRRRRRRRRTAATARNRFEMNESASLFSHFVSTRVTFRWLSV